MVLLEIAAVAHGNKAPVNAAAKKDFRVGTHPGGHLQPAAAAVAVLKIQNGGRRIKAGTAKKDGVNVLSLHVNVFLTFPNAGCVLARGAVPSAAQRQR